MTDDKTLRPLIAANWKMHGDMSWIEKLSEFDEIFPSSERVELDVLICPPNPFIFPMMERCGGKDIWLGAQNCHAETIGAHTGEDSAQMLESSGADYVIVGHSERRALGESDADVQAKALACAEAGLIPIICVGESLTQREAGDAISVVSAQILASIPNIDTYVVAYEPVWAIGTGKVPTLDDIADMHSAIRRQVGGGVRILYGGSVKPTNAQGILALTDVNGALI
ncbi:MAG: triose-phosphate isomerase, partial [Litorimonas sp.]